MSVFRPGPGGLMFAEIANERATATICLQGAQLTHWQPRSQAAPVLFVSATAQFLPGKAIRGGIPVCWPWFGPHDTDPSLPSHGFANKTEWQADEPRQRRDGATELLLRLQDSDASRALWPHAFLLEYRIVVGEQLELELVTVNTGAATFGYGEALHAYFNVGDIACAEVQGLDGVPYIDKTDGGRRKQQAGAVRFTSAVDRVFAGTETPCTLVDTSLQRRIHIAKTGSRSTVVWNPGEEKAAAYADLGNAPRSEGGWRQLVCVETANALENKRVLAPGESHRVTAVYRVESDRA